MALVLENQPQTPASISLSIQNINVIKSPGVRRENVIVEETFLSFVWFDTVIAQMLDVSTETLWKVVFLQALPQAVLTNTFSGSR